jgi:DNA-binding transcriptional ArsR family regulator
MELKVPSVALGCSTIFINGDLTEAGRMSGQQDGSKRWRNGLPPHLGLGLSDATRKALQHPIRRRILRRLHAREEAQSPIQMLDLAPGAPIRLISYHAKVLRKLQLIRLSEMRQVRGATQHFYVSEVSDDEMVLDVLSATETQDREPGVA